MLDDAPEDFQQKIHDYATSVGPGLISGAADDDPSGVASYSQIGARFGLQYAWLALYTLPFLIVVQEICGRIGLATRHGIAWHIRRSFPPIVLYICVSSLFVANVFNISADLRAMADGFRLIIPSLPIGLLIVFFAVITLILEILLPYRTYARYLKFITLSLLGYILATFFALPNWIEVGKALIIPHIEFNMTNLVLISATLGTTISPYLFFWQTSTEIEEDSERILDKKENINQENVSQAVKFMRQDVYSGMTASNIVMFFIIVACGTTLHTHAIQNITSAADASIALKPFAGSFASILFALGIIGTGLLALPVLAGSAAYAVSEVFGWKEGLNLRVHNGRAFYAIMSLAIVGGVLLNIFDGSAFEGLIYAALVNAIAVPIILFCILSISSDPRIMGRMTNSKPVSVIGYVALAIMIVASVVSAYAFATGYGL